MFLTVLGVGYGNYRDEMMKKLANAGNGNYAFLDGILEAKGRDDNGWRAEFIHLVESAQLLGHDERR